MKILSLRPWLSLCLLLLMLGASPVAAESPRLVRVGAFSLYPAIFLDADGKINGFYVDMLAEVAAKENLRIEYVYGSWNEGLERIKSGDVDLLTSVAYTEERARFMDYGKKPLLTVWAELYVRKDSIIDSIMKVDGKKVAVMKNDYNARYFIDMVKKFGFHCDFLEVADFDQVFLAVQQGRADAGVANVIFGSSKRQKYGLKSSEVMFNPFDIYFTVARGRNADLLATLDRYLDSWRLDENSVYHQARQKWGGGQAATVEVIPLWVYQAAGGLLVVMAVGLGFIVLLRRQVRLDTEVIVQRESSLKEKNVEMERFVYTVSHDLRSPLITVKSFLALLEQDLKAGDAQLVGKDIEYIKLSADRMERLLNELLQLSRVGRVDSQPVEISYRELINEILATVAGQITSKGVEVHVDDQQLQLYGDAVRLAQIWQNLVDNAVKYMGDQQQPKIDLGFEFVQGQPVFYVSDNGMGFDPAYSEKIFELFQQLDGHSDGSGLGLALVKRIVELYNGRIWAESAGRGQGSCFRFTLPAALGIQGENA